MEASSSIPATMCLMTAGSTAARDELPDDIGVTVGVGVGVGEGAIVIVGGVETGAADGPHEARARTAVSAIRTQCTPETIARMTHVSRAPKYPRVMSRRSTPKRIDEARRAATRNRLIGDGASEATADAWIAAWEAQAAQDGLERGAAYWEAGWEWIAEQRRSRVRP